jgi:hypothetical protein
MFFSWLSCHKHHCVARRFGVELLFEFSEVFLPPQIAGAMKPWAIIIHSGSVKS